VDLQIVGGMPSMKWNAKDSDMYVQAKEYIDTVVIPLVPIRFTDEIKQLTSASDFISMLCMEIERICKGRMLLAPTFYYVSGDLARVGALQSWEMALDEAKFKHIYFLSTDNAWKQDENHLSGSFLWIPSIPLEHLEIGQAQDMIRQQAAQIIDIFKQHWEKNT
jgi:hypothetical protein